MNEPKKRIVFLAVLLVIGGGLVSLAARSNDTNEPTEKPKASTDLSFLNDLDSDPQTSQPSENRELLLKMMLGVVLVGILGIAALYVSKRVLPRVTNASGKEIRILETAYLGPRKAVHLIEVSNQKVLIGSTNDSITMLTHVEEGWLNAPAPETNNPASL